MSPRSSTSTAARATALTLAWLGAACDQPRPHPAAISRAELDPPVSTEAPPSTDAPGEAGPGLAGSASAAPSAPIHAPAPPRADRAAVAEALKGRRPRAFGDALRGVRTRFDSEDAVALTLDLCDGAAPRAFDQELFDFLGAEHIPATLFVSGRWLRHHEELARELAAQPQFSIQNHGLGHRPCTVDGRVQYGIAGTLGLPAMIREIEDNADAIESVTGARPRFYRPGTAHFDDVCVDALAALGEVPTGFTIAGDGGLGFDRSQVKAAVSSARPGAILLLHAHRPSGSSFEGLRDAVPTLRARGLRFVKLDEVL